MLLRAPMSMHWRENKQAFEELVWRVTPTLYGYFRKRLGPPYRPGRDPEDLTQEVWCRVVRAEYDPSRPFERWAYTIARNLYYDELRRRRRELDVERLLEDPIDELFWAEDIDSEAIFSCLNRLTKEKRDIIHQRFWEGMRWTEIAESRSISVESINSMMYRAKAKLRECLESKGMGKP